ncbi:MAG TPA: hypothetical protein VGB59_04760 [Allosphingosinicella sp.]|jgi:hypothetical protein
MNWAGIIWALAACLLLASDARAEPPKAGERYEITRSYETSMQGSDGSSSETSGTDTIIERVIAVHQSGLELEYSLSPDADAADAVRNWQFPALVLKPSGKPMQLLNSKELAARVEAWLKAARLPRAACGRWIFTWNAFRIECDPQSVLKSLEGFDLRSVELREGAVHKEDGAAAPGTLALQSNGSGGAIYKVVMDVDPDAVRLARAESDVVVGEISQKLVTLEAALRERAKERISGKMTVTFETDTAGNVLRKTRATTLETRLPDGESERETLTHTVERRRL